MAGGAGERFWPLSRRLRPKQFLKLASPDRSLIQQTVDRLVPLVGTESVFIATGPHLVSRTVEDLPELARSQVFAEPHKRNTAGCLVWVAANLLASDPAARETCSMAIVTADHRISPDEGFRSTIDAALTVAEATRGLVTIGIPPTRPETGFGYIEVDRSGSKLGTSSVAVWPVKRFREKPDEATAAKFVASGHFLWNSGTFFWTLDGFLSELEQVSPELYGSIFQIAAAIRSGDHNTAHQLFEALPSISIDYALMERAKQVFVAEAAFDWDDVGSWDALDRSLHADDSGNVGMGESVLVESQNNIVVNECPEAVVTLLGVSDLAVVVTGDAVLVCPKDRAQEVRKVVEALKEREIDRT